MLYNCLTQEMNSNVSHFHEISEHFTNTKKFSLSDEINSITAVFQMVNLRRREAICPNSTFKRICGRVKKKTLFLAYWSYTMIAKLPFFFLQAELLGESRKAEYN